MQTKDVRDIVARVLNKETCHLPLHTQAEMASVVENIDMAEHKTRVNKIIVGETIFYTNQKGLELWNTK